MRASGLGIIGDSAKYPEELPLHYMLDESVTYSNNRNGVRHRDHEILRQSARPAPGELAKADCGQDQRSSRRSLRRTQQRHESSRARGLPAENWRLAGHLRVA